MASSVRQPPASIRGPTPSSADPPFPPTQPGATGAHNPTWRCYLSDEMFEEKLRAALQNVCFNQEDESWWKLEKPTAIIRPLCSIWCIFLFLNCCSRSSPPPVMFVTPWCCSHSDYFGRKAAQSPLVGILLVSHKQLLVCLVVPVGQCDCQKCACVIVFYIWLAFHPHNLSGSLFYTWKNAFNESIACVIVPIISKV